MKLFHTENDKEVVYVQLQDIVNLLRASVHLPETVIAKVFSNLTKIGTSNWYEFVRFDEEYEVVFFRDLDFVIDFDKYKDLTDEQLVEEGRKLVAKADEIAKEWNNLSEDERVQNYHFRQEHEILKHMLNSLGEIYAVKHRKKKMPFPKFVKVPKAKRQFVKKRNM